MYQVVVSGWFAAAHQLRVRGVLESLHGHNWHVRVCFSGGTVDGDELLVDFTEIRARLDAVLREFHDRNLNDLPHFGGRNPSAEHVAAVIASALGADLNGVRLDAVEVEEAPGFVARYRPPPLAAR